MGDVAVGEERENDERGRGEDEEIVEFGVADGFAHEAVDLFTGGEEDRHGDRERSCECRCGHRVRADQHRDDERDIGRETERP